MRWRTEENGSRSVGDNLFSQHLGRLSSSSMRISAVSRSESEGAEPIPRLLKRLPQPEEPLWETGKVRDGGDARRGSGFGGDGEKMALEAAEAIELGEYSRTIDDGL